MNNEPYSLPLGQFYQVFFTYGAYCESFFQTYLVAIHHLLAATTQAEIDAVEVPA